MSNLLAPEVWGLFLSAFISSTLAPGGSEIVLSYLLIDGKLAPTFLVIVATLGNSLGAITTWFLGYLMAVKINPKGITRTLSDRSVEIMQNWGAAALLLSWVPLLGDGLCLAAGWLRLPKWRCFVVIVVGKAIRYMAIAYMLAQ
ncbi:MAG: DedA family protein [Pseudomonadales bacterium]|nr:DedA family protein [Pseudomonadales bacterium]